MPQKRTSKAVTQTKAPAKKAVAKKESAATKTAGAKASAQTAAKSAPKTAAKKPSVKKTTAKKAVKTETKTSVKQAEPETAAEVAKPKAKPKLSLKKGGAKPSGGLGAKLKLSQKAEPESQDTESLQVNRSGPTLSMVGATRATRSTYAQVSPSAAVQPQKASPATKLKHSPAARQAEPAVVQSGPALVPTPPSELNPTSPVAGQGLVGEDAAPRRNVAETRRTRQAQRPNAAEPARQPGRRGSRPQQRGETAGRKRVQVEQRYRTGRNRLRKRSEEAMPQRKPVGRIEIGSNITLVELAKSMAYRAEVLVKICQELGEDVKATDAIGWDLASLLVEHLEGEPVRKVEQSTSEKILESIAYKDADKEPARPPVVTVMGHVDHGKTSLLDRLRSSRVADGEAGGITQHIGASLVERDGARICFIDTPGHEAFSHMRRRGAQVTDIVVLVVAANDGVMPQTLEAIDQSRNADVGVVVAINKCDLKGANPQKVRGQLIENNVVPDDSGGDVQFVEVSAETGDGIDRLLQAILDEAEVRELSAPQDGAGQGTILESRIVKGVGPVATVLVKSGTLRVGDSIVSQQQYGRVRSLVDDKGDRLKSATPGVPVVVHGLGGVIEPGAQMFSVGNDKQARRYAEDYQAEQDSKSLENSHQDRCRRAGPETASRAAGRQTAHSAAYHCPHRCSGHG